MSRDDQQEPVVITDKRKVDRGGSTAAAPADADAVSAADAPSTDAPSTDAPTVGTDENARLLAERTADLQRLQAEYANYRKRAERERLAAGDVATGRVLAEFLPVLDNLDRARAHGDLTGGLKAVADELDGILAKLGLEAFGEVGDRFDPAIHEAVLHDESPDVTEPTCTTVMRSGYKYRDRLLRPAMVGVSDPADATAEPTLDPEAEAAPDEESTHES